MVISFQYDRKEWVRCHRKYLFLSKTLTQFEIWVALALCALCVGYLVFMGPNWSSVSLCILCVGVVFMLGQLYFRQPVRIFDKTPGFSLPHKLDFNEDGVDYKTEGYVSSTPWEKFVTFVETEEAFYLVESRPIYTMVPKGALSEKEIRQLRQLLRQQLPENRFPRRKKSRLSV